MTKIIQTEDLVFAYPAGEDTAPVQALQGVNLSIEQGSFTVVLGHNGSGKSTLAKHMNALLEIRRRVGMVFQNPDNQIVANVVEEDVAFGPENLGVPTEEIQRRVAAALQAVGMDQFSLHAPHHLSGGQKQRVAIAGVIAMEPACIVMDESTAMLDPCGRREALDTVRRLNREKGITIVLITHHMDEAAMADRVVVMDSGRVVMDGPPQEILVRMEELRNIGLDVPHTVELLHGLREDGFAVPLDALSVEACAGAVIKSLESERRCQPQKEE